MFMLKYLINDNILVNEDEFKSHIKFEVIFSSANLDFLFHIANI